MVRVLSIDWDYFVEENPLLDWGHREEHLFLEMMWQVRSTRLILDAENEPAVIPVDLAEVVPFRGSESMIMRLPCIAGDYQIAVAESHLAILQLLKGQSNIHIVNIDAHHDLGYGIYDPYYFAMREPCCGSWGHFLLTEDRVKSWTQIYPAWRRKYPEQTKKKGTFPEWTKKKLGAAFKVSTQEPLEVVSWRSVDYVFLCRSGCWVPPNYDQRFNQFCRMLGSSSSGLPVRKLAEASTQASQAGEQA